MQLQQPMRYATFKMKDSDKIIVDRIDKLRNYFLKNSEINNSFTPEYIIADKISQLINKKETLIIDDFYFIINTFNNITSEKHYDGSGWQDFQMQIIKFLNNNGIEVILNSTGSLIIKFITTKFGSSKQG